MGSKWKVQRLSKPNKAPPEQESLTHMVSTSTSTCVSLVLHGNNCLDAGQLLLIALLGQRPALHGHPAASHPRTVLITLRRERGTSAQQEHWTHSVIIRMTSNNYRYIVINMLGQATCNIQRGHDSVSMADGCTVYIVYGRTHGEMLCERMQKCLWTKRGRPQREERGQ